jgi:Nucleotidyltransferase domain
VDDRVDKNSRHHERGTMTAPRLPTPRHHRVLAELTAELRADADVCGIVLVGSTARGTARADSDLDPQPRTQRW